jgi:hypothetical protein
MIHSADSSGLSFQRAISENDTATMGKFKAWGINELFFNSTFVYEIPLFSTFGKG